MPRPRYRKSAREWKRPAISSICFDALQHLLEQAGQAQQIGDVPAPIGLAERAAHLPEIHRQQMQGDQLAGERLGRGHADLGTGMRVERALGLARRHAADHVADGDAAGPA